MKTSPSHFQSSHFQTDANVLMFCCWAESGVGDVPICWAESGVGDVPICLVESGVGDVPICIQVFDGQADN